MNNFDVVCQNEGEDDQYQTTNFFVFIVANLSWILIKKIENNIHFTYLSNSI